MLPLVKGPALTCHDLNSVQTLGQSIIDVQSGRIRAESKCKGRETMIRFTLSGAGEPGTDNNNNR